MIFSEFKLYKYIPPNFDLIKQKDIYILQRGIVIETSIYNKEPEINFMVEELLHIDKFNKPNDHITHIVFNVRYSKEEIAENLHMMLYALANNEVQGNIAKSFVASLLYEICIKNENYWIKKYFPNWNTKDKDIKELIYGV